MTRTTLEAQIASMAAQLSGSPPDRLDPAMPFALLGLDSLATVELAGSIEQVSGVDLPPEVVADCGSPRVLAAWLRQQHATRQTSPDPYEQMFSDARRLSRATCDVRRATGYLSRATCDVQGGLRSARSILLTGATGFLGRWIAREILDTSEATLVCLVRGGRERLERSLRTAGVDAAVMRRHVRAVEGDLTLPRLGLTRDEFAGLGGEVDAICHAAASVNWIHSYSALRAANVIGTGELLRLATEANAHFHFVSSLSACYSTAAPAEVDERYEALPDLRGLHLGYAQTKAVAEALVSTAARHGLPATIYRPALIGGHSRESDFNAEDLLSLLIRGCVQMGAAPDLDWTLDVLPVDVAARHIVQLSTGAGTYHLKHPRPRHWRECVLWMRLYGYPLTLMPFAAWMRQLEHDAEAMAARGERHPLAPLRRFFSDRPEGCGGLTRPQLYEDVRRTRARAEHTERCLGLSVRECPELDGSLLEHYFHVMRSRGQLPPPSAPLGRRAGSRRPLSADHEQLLSSLVEPTLGSLRSSTLLTRGSSQSIVSDLIAWQSNRPTGLFGYRLETIGGPHDVILKIKARGCEVTGVGEAVARLCGEELGSAYARWRDRVGFAASHLREIAVYRQTDPRVVNHVPRLLGSIADDEREIWAVALERIADASYLDSVSDSAWTDADIAVTIDGLSRLQSVWYGRERELRGLPWSGFERTAASMTDMADLWSALATHARSRFCAWADPSISSIHRRLIGEAGRWWRALDAPPRTLIHNDFNPRNICLRRNGSGSVLCAYDWELATLGAPQRDLAEFLCFVLPEDVSKAAVDGWIGMHKRTLERGTGTTIDGDAWIEGFRSSLYDVLVDRLSMYALIHRIRRQSFLPRVVRTWRRLYGFFPLVDDA